jgi:hypothetical protein
MVVGAILMKWTTMCFVIVLALACNNGGDAGEGEGEAAEGEGEGTTAEGEGEGDTLGEGEGETPIVPDPTVPNDVRAAYEALQTTINARYGRCLPLLTVLFPSYAVYEPLVADPLEVFPGDGRSAANVGACTAAVAALPCDSELELFQIPACARLSFGSFAEGEACVDSGQCQSGICNQEGDCGVCTDPTGVCVQDSECATTERCTNGRRCAVIVVDGQPCDSDYLLPCGDDSTCTYDQNGSGTCQPRPAAGESCAASSDCEDGSFCQGLANGQFRCTRYALLNEPCNTVAGEVCELTAFCDPVARVCRETVDLTDQPCELLGLEGCEGLRTGLTCVQDATFGSCQPVQTAVAGEACVEFAIFCIGTENGVECINGTCVAPPSDVGASCEDDEYCDDGLHCAFDGAEEFGVCTERAAVGATCTAGDRCDRGARCTNAGVCEFASDVYEQCVEG